ncbi:MAG TPA: acireductone synthase [Blastocatellia bacterium]|nr:acireductone synthase [Blastocatellia bacterium]
MSASPINPPVNTVLLDIEGTTTPIDFVYKVLFPYARAHAEEFIALHRSELVDDVGRLIRENADDIARGLNPPSVSSSAGVKKLAAYVRWLMDQDRKATPLKSLQGKIWQAGYDTGELHSQVFEDVPPAFKRWSEQGKDICIYSSGSVLAQKLLFANTEAGDLTPFIRGYFDTNTGPKGEAESYRRIGEALKLRPSAMVFVSDVISELEAARIAGVETSLCLRPGNHSQPGASRFSVIRSFDEVFNEHLLKPGS